MQFDYILLSLLQLRGSISVPVRAAGIYVDSSSAMSSSVFTQCVCDDGILDYEIDTSKAKMTFKETPTKKPKFAVIHDVARPARQFVISQSKTGLAHPVETCPGQHLAHHLGFFQVQFMVNNIKGIYLPPPTNSSKLPPLINHIPKKHNHIGGNSGHFRGSLGSA